MWNIRDSKIAILGLRFVGPPLAADIVSEATRIA